MEDIVIYKPIKVAFRPLITFEIVRNWERNVLFFEQNYYNVGSAIDL